MKKLIFIAVLLLLFSFSVSAEEKTDDIYGEQYEISGADELKDSLPNETREFFEKNGIAPSSPDWVGRLSDKNVFKHILEFVTTGAKAPLRAGVGIIGVILVGATLNHFGTNNSSVLSSSFAASLSVMGIAIGQIWSTVSAATTVIKGCGTFMLSFIPVFASIIAISGGALTSVSMGALLIGAAQLIVSLASSVILPLMGGYLGVGICESVSPLIGKSGIGEGIKKISMWILSFASTVFTGILGIQTVVNSSSDSLSLKTAKFIIGTSVPIAGSTISEAISTVTASISVLRASVGIYGIVALGFIMLPIIFELIIWRTVIMVSIIAADIFSLSSVSGVLRSIDAMFSILLGITLLTGTVFIISLTVVTGAVKA